MRVTFAKKDVFWIVSLVIAVISAVLDICYSVMLSSATNTINIRLILFPLAVLILTLIASFGKNTKEKGKTNDALMFAASIIISIEFIIALTNLSSFASSAFGLNGSVLSRILAGLDWVLYSLVTVCFILVVIFFILFSTVTNEDNRPTYQRIILISSLVLLIVSAVMVAISVLGLVALSFTSSFSAADVIKQSEYMAVMVGYAYLIFLLCRNVSVSPKPVLTSSASISSSKPVNNPVSGNGDVSAEEKKIELLKSYANLREQGVITEEEFQAKKKELMK